MVPSPTWSQFVSLGFIIFNPAEIEIKVNEKIRLSTMGNRVVK
jgi:hypothetical protein